MERLCSSISGFDQEWVKRCVPAAEEQIRQLQDILAEYHYTIPAAYLYFLRRMGQDDGGLLGYAVKFCSDDDKLMEQVKYSLSLFPEFFSCVSKSGNCGDRNDG